MRWLAGLAAILLATACGAGTSGDGDGDGAADADTSTHDGAAWLDGAASEDGAPPDGTVMDGAAEDAAPADGGGWWATLDAGADASAHDVAYVLCRATLDAYCRGNRRCCPHEGRTLPPCDEIAAHENCERIASWDGFVDGRIVVDEDAWVLAYEELRRKAETCEAIGWNASKGGIQGTLPEGSDCTPSELTSSGDRRVCASGLYCQLMGTDTSYTGTCRVLGEEGDSCWDYDDCRAGVYCEKHAAPGGAPSSEGSCLPLIADGESCDDTLSCESRHCHAGVCSEPTDAETWCTHPGPAG